LGGQEFEQNVLQYLGTKYKENMIVKEVDLDYFHGTYWARVHPAGHPEYIFSVRVDGLGKFHDTYKKVLGEKRAGME